MFQFTAVDDWYKMFDSLFGDIIGRKVQVVQRGKLFVVVQKDFFDHGDASVSDCISSKVDFFYL